MANWFNAQIDPNDERRQTWEDIAINLGKPGYPMSGVIKWAKRHVYTGNDNTNIDTCFKLIDWDEGRL